MMKIGCHNGGEILCRAVLNISENRSQYIDVGIGGRSTETAEKREANLGLITDPYNHL